LWALKNASTGASIYAAETLWDRHQRVAAAVTMVAVNGMMAAMGVHNASVIQSLK
jgi:hypothetical protein